MTQPWQNYFSYAHDFALNNAQFFNITNANGMVIKHWHGGDPVSTTLWQHVASGAIFDSAERYSPARCHPGTRERIFIKVEDWIDDLAPTERILWLYGPAGSGKSALAQSICDRLRQSHPDRYGASFFFTKGPTDRGNGLKLFTTLSYQLAVQYPSMRREINNALCRDPSLPTKSMEVQLFSLIIQPLLRCQPFPAHSPTLIIDGLDECADHPEIDAQVKILTLISQSIVEYNIPLRFMIASRPEFWIRAKFENSPLQNITLPLSLREDQDVDTDIKAYLTDEFEKIRIENNRIMASVDAPWPPGDVIDYLVYTASGQYIYASTVLKFVGKSSRFIDPQEQLRIVTVAGPHRALAFSELDKLYETIISTYPRWDKMKRVLGGIICGANLAVIEIILGVEHTQLMLALDALSSLVNRDRPKPLSKHERLLEPIFGPLCPAQDRISLCHLSFSEFLEDKARSGQYFIDVRNIWDAIVRAFFGIIHRNLEGNYEAGPHVPFNIGSTTYHRMMFNMSFQCSMSYSDVDIVLALVNDTICRILLLDPNRISHPGFFKEEMDTIALVLSDMLRQCSHSSKAMDDALNDTFMRFKEAASTTWTRIIHHVSTCSSFNVTPVLVYLSEFGTSRPVTLNELLSVPWHSIDDVLATLEQHQDIIAFNYYHEEQEWKLETQGIGDNLDLRLDDVGLPVELYYLEDEVGWRTRGEWKNQRVLLAYRYLHRILNTAYDKDHPSLFVATFLIGPLSDIDSKRYFDNPYNLSILGLMSDFSAWSYLAPLKTAEVVYFIPSVLRWLNRQLINHDSVKLLGDHDKSLIMKMRATMRQVFEHHFLPNFKGQYHSELHYVSNLSTKDLEMGPGSSQLRGILLPKRHCQQEESAYLPHEDSVCTIYWRPFHDDVFRDPEYSETISPTIDPVDWHPYLASCLLSAFAKLLISKVDPKFELEKSCEITEERFAYVSECLPYAEPNQQNLDSLRAIAYLLPRTSLEWNPPIDFWSLSVEFLKTYDRSIVSEDELNLFQSCMVEWDDIRSGITYPPE